MDESEIPIDIHTNKLLDWLVSRRHVSKDWSQNVIVIREKINAAIQDMPVHEGIAKLLSGSYINYYHCNSIIDILKETELTSKNMFGIYGSQRMKDWVEVLKLYEKDNVYLGEVASLLLRNVNYEIPGLRKQIVRCQHMQQEYDKKETDYEKQANSWKNDFTTNCKALGIKGKKIRVELVDKAKEFPSMNKKLALEAAKLKEAVEFYKQAVSALNPDSKRKVLSTLTYIIEKGDTTVYEFNRGKAPSGVEAAVMVTVEDDIAADDVIDFDAVDENIDWGISAEDSSVDEITKKPVEEAVARGDEARTVLGHPATREKLINDIMELTAFLRMRIHECNHQGDGLVISLLPESLQVYDEPSFQNFLTEANKLLAEITSSTALHYLNITTNIRYVDQLSNQLQQKINNHEKMLACKDSVKAQRAAAIAEAQSIEPRVDLLIQRSKELQELIENDISRRYKGRPVNLMGGVNVL